MLSNLTLQTSVGIFTFLGKMSTKVVWICSEKGTCKYSILGLSFLNANHWGIISLLIVTVQKLNWHVNKNPHSRGKCIQEWCAPYGPTLNANDVNIVFTCQYSKCWCNYVNYTWPSSDTSSHMRIIWCNLMCKSPKPNSNAWA